MQAWIVKWPNGDITLAIAPTKDALMLLLDEEGDLTDGSAFVPVPSNATMAFELEFIDGEPVDDGGAAPMLTVAPWGETMHYLDDLARKKARNTP